MIAQRVRKYGAKARYQGEEAGKGQSDTSSEVSAAKIVREGFLEAVSWPSMCPCCSSCLRCTGGKGLLA